MQNHAPYGNMPQGFRYNYYPEEWNPQQEPSTNRFIYIKPEVNDSSPAVNGCPKVLVNPHFNAKSKVFVNPNFSGCLPSSGHVIHVNPRMRNGITLQATLKGKAECPTKIEHNTCHTQSTKIHINPNAKCVQMPIPSQSIHINPKFANVATSAIRKALTKSEIIPMHDVKENIPLKKLNDCVVLTKTKLVRTPYVSSNKVLKRRNSVKSKYNIVKTGLSPKKASSTIGCTSTTGIKSPKNRFKVDNRVMTSLSIINKHRKKYVYINKLSSTSNLAKTRIIKSTSTIRSPKHLSVVYINGIVYRKSINSIRRASVSTVKREPITQPILNRQLKSKLKLIGPKRGSFEARNRIVKKFKIIRRHSPKKIKGVKISPKKHKKCNIPCPSYRKYGICKGIDNGKCIWKHDPDQIALCTRFLQGACIKDKCFLSHNVSPEKMPTCKYYLEGSCSRESCPYMHIKISPKAEVCRDFLEGFCKKAAECNKRHQYLCPEYEKYEKCVKQRCPYPHGNMVRTYLINKNKFAKKCSAIELKNQKSAIKLSKSAASKSSKNEQINDKRRYYAKKISKSEESTDMSTDLNAEQSDAKDKIGFKNMVGLHLRPKLGSLPSFIPFEDS